MKNFQEKSPREKPRLNKRRIMSFKDFVKQTAELPAEIPANEKPDQTIEIGGDGILLPADFVRH